MRIAVTGSKGQVATSLLELAGPKLEMVPLGRPAFDLTDRAAVLAGLEAARPDVIVNAAAYAAVDNAEAEEATALKVNREGAGHAAEAAARLGVPIFHLSTDCVFDGALDLPYRADDPTARPGLTGSAARKRSPGLAKKSVILGAAGSIVPSAPCLGSTRRATRSAWWPTSAAIRPRPWISPTR